jgi:hypothetical protein
MGYYTHYTLSYEIDNEDGEILALDKLKVELKAKGVELPPGIQLEMSNLEERLEEVLEDEGFCSNSPLMSFVNQNADDCKWYEHEEDMRRLSNMFPTVFFTLEGEGEESGDIWKEYYLGGKMQKCKARLEFDDFDKAKLK